MALDLSSLEKAIQSLENALTVSHDIAFIAKLSDTQVNTIRAGVIQNFEFTYELCWKFIQRWLRENVPISEVEFPRTRKELFRLAARHGLIEDPLPWFDYGDARNIIAHTYDETKSKVVYDAATHFINDAIDLWKRLATKND